MKAPKVSWQDFRERKLRLDCSVIELTKNGSDKVTHRGPGELWQDDGGILVFKCFDQAAMSSAVGAMLRDSAIELGKLIPNDSHYGMRLVAFDGTEWTAENVWPARKFSFITNQAVVTGELRSLKCVCGAKKTSENACIRLIFLEQDVDVWRGMVDTSIKCNGIDCLIRVLRERDSDVKVEITGARKLPSNFEVRVVEALRFVFAKTIHVSAIERSEGDAVETTLISPVRTSNTRLLPPLQASLSTACTDVKQLFRSYLKFVHAQTSSEFVHPCSIEIRHACEASANSIEAGAIGLCVAVEGIANLIPHERSSAADEAIATILKVIPRWLKRRALDADVQSRAIGLLSQLKNSRVKDRLKPLMDNGRLDPICFEAWQKLRNQGVHSRRSTLEEIDDRRFQELLDAIHKVYVCMYQGAVAGLVGNEGGVVSEVINLESSGVEAPDRRPRHDEHYHEA